eukprot:UN24336
MVLYQLIFAAEFFRCIVVFSKNFPPFFAAVWVNNSTKSNSVSIWNSERKAVVHEE